MGNCEETAEQSRLSYFVCSVEIYGFLRTNATFQKSLMEPSVKTKR